MADGCCDMCLLCQVFGSDAGEDAYSEGGSGAVSISPRGNAYAGQYEQAPSSHVSNRESHQTAQVTCCAPLVDELLMTAQAAPVISTCLAQYKHVLQNQF